jgi:hypothetical protein
MDQMATGGISNAQGIAGSNTGQLVFFGLGIAIFMALFGLVLGMILFRKK